MNDAQEDYLKAIYEIQLHSPDEPVGTSLLAKKLGVSLRYNDSRDGFRVSLRTLKSDLDNAQQTLEQYSL